MHVHKSGVFGLPPPMTAEVICYTLEFCTSEILRAIRGSFRFGGSWAKAMEPLHTESTLLGFPFPVISKGKG